MEGCSIPETTILIRDFPFFLSWLIAPERNWVFAKVPEGNITVSR